MKSIGRTNKYVINESLLSQERGLKYFSRPDEGPLSEVAPLAGAWIEISIVLITLVDVFVAPLAGAWIEIG